MVRIVLDHRIDYNEISAAIERATGAVGAGGARVVKSSAYRIEGGAKAGCPVDTGLLKSSIGTEFEGDGRFGEMSAEIGSSVNYAGYVNNGTRYQRPQPFLTRAYDAEVPNFIAAAERLADVSLRGITAGG